MGKFKVKPGKSTARCYGSKCNAGGTQEYKERKVKGNIEEVTWEEIRKRNMGQKYRRGQWIGMQCRGGGRERVQGGERHLCCTGLRGPPPPIQKAAAEITTFSYFVKTFQLFKLSTPISKRAADARTNLSVFDSVANCWKSLPG